MATYYLSPTGSDSNSGTISSPWWTLNKAWTVISAGDVIYMRGGTYTYTAQQFLSGKNGTSGNYIFIWAYPGETPVITRASSFSHSPATNVGIYLNGNYTDWKGIEIYNFYQQTSSVWGGMWLQDSNYNRFEQINYHACGFPFSIGMGPDDTSTENYVLNSDFHHNYDPLSDYDDADGAEVYVAYGCVNTFEGCRFWSNSDDGIDQLQSDGMLIIKNCWAWSNGYREDGTTKGGNGHGFKLGEGTTAHYTTHLTTITNCISFHNRQGGFTMGTSTSICWCYNNTAYHNADGDVYNLGFEFENDHCVHILKNNIAHANQHPDDLQANYAGCNEDHNTWDVGFSIADLDFVSINSSGVDGARQADGSLPVIDFLHLRSGSDLIDAGTVVGLPYSGSAPDLGAFEFGGAVQTKTLRGTATITFSSPAPEYVYYLECVPDTHEFTLEDVVHVVDPSTGTLLVCFDEAISAYFDPAYEGLHDRLSNFRNYCIHRTYDHIYSGDSSDACVITFGSSAALEGKSYLRGTASVFFSLTATGQCTSSGGLLYGSSSITFSQSGAIIEKVPSFNIEYGALYNWFAATYSVGGASIAPSGWHVPSLLEWITLFYAIDPVNGAATAGGPLKETGFTHWLTPNTGATNSSGFFGRGGGYRLAGVFVLQKELGIFWNTETDEWTDNAISFRYDFYDVPTWLLLQSAGCSIRLIKDNSTDPGTMTDYDGNIYDTVKIGDQVWMAENLMVTHYNDGTPIPNVTNNTTWDELTTGAYCWYNNDPDNGYEEIEVPQVRTSTGTASITFSASGGMPPSISPANLHAIQSGAGQHINISWDAVAGITGYVLQRKPQDYNGNWIPYWKNVYAGTSLSFADHIEDEGTMVDATVVTYRVCVYNAIGDGPWSGEESCYWYE